MPPVMRSMPLQRLFATTTPQMGRSEPLARPIGFATAPAVPAHAHPDDLDLAIGDESQPHMQARAQPTLQRAGEADPAAPTLMPPPEAGAGPAPAPTSPTPAKPGPDLDELARQLYGPLSALLRAELWLDRERSGRSLTR